MAAPHPALVGLIRGEQFPPGFRVTMPVVVSAADHRVGPLLDDAIRQQGLDGDHDALIRLTMLSMESAADTDKALQTLDGVLDAADTLGIDVAVFKGLAIGARWYPRPALRPAYDVDVFVAPSQADRLGDLVAAFDTDPGSGLAITAMVTEGRVFEHTVTVDGFDVDFHRDPMNMVLLTRQHEEIWRTTDTVPLAGGRAVRTLSPEWSIVQALLHLFRDNFADLLHVYDVALMMDDDPEWALVAAYADREGWADLIRFALGVVCDTLGRPSPLPRDITPISRRIIAMLWPQRLFLRGFDSLTATPRRQTAASILVAGRRLELAGPLARRVFPPRSVIDLRSEPTTDPYLVALYRWRHSQHHELRRRRVRSSSVQNELPPPA